MINAKVGRRAALALGGAALLAACAGAPAQPLVMAAGEPGGFYIEFANLLVTALAARGIPTTAMRTGGSVDNIAMVAAGRAAIGLALSDTALAAQSGLSPFPAPVRLRALGRVYENYMQLAVRAEDPLRTAADLAGRPVSLGAVGSGAAEFGDRLLAAAAISARVTRRPLEEAADALESGASDAVLFSGGVPTPALAELADRRPIRLLPLAAQLPALQSRYGSAYTLVGVPAGVYGAPTAVPTVGVANLLVAAPELDDQLAANVVRTLVEAAPTLVPVSALGTQYLDQRSLIDTGDVALHPGAAAAYRELHG